MKVKTKIQNNHEQKLWEKISKTLHSKNKFAKWNKENSRHHPSNFHYIRILQKTWMEKRDTIITYNKTRK